MGTWWQDGRYGLRMLRKNPGITVIAVVTLALGMAGNTVIFSFFNAFFLRPMPFHEPDRLVDLDETAPRWNLEYTGLSCWLPARRAAKVDPLVALRSQ